MMTIPGLALFYGGLSRAQNVLSTVMQSFAITCLVSILWLCFGYSLAFGVGNDYIGGGEKFWYFFRAHFHYLIFGMPPAASPCRYFLC